MHAGIYGKGKRSWNQRGIRDNVGARYLTPLWRNSKSHKKDQHREPSRKVRARKRVEPTVLNYDPNVEKPWRIVTEKKTRTRGKHRGLRDHKNSNGEAFG